jgi:hypothetical protein
MEEETTGTATCLAPERIVLHHATCGRVLAGHMQKESDTKKQASDLATKTKKYPYLM